MSLEDIKSQIKLVPISQVINHYIPIKRAGNNYVATCPFHNDTKPSLSINDKKGMFKCFACNTGGNHIDFVLYFKKLPFIEAIKELCTILNINADSLDKKEQKDPNIVMAHRVLSMAAKIYRKLALTEKVPPYNLFLEERKLSPEIAEKFQLGFAPNNNVIATFLATNVPANEQAFARQIALEIGMVREYRNELQDVFTDRIMFPLWDLYGQVVGFTSRRIHEHQKAKYMNSKESFIYNKRNLLYGFHFARNIMREKSEAILVEGNMDAVAMHKFGFTHTVACMGTAVTDKQIGLLKPLASTLYLCLDNDEAGFKASIKANEICMTQKILPKFLDLSPEKDPDDFLKKEGGLFEMQNRMDKAPFFIDVMIEKLIPDPLPTSIEDKLNILNQVFETLSPLGTEFWATERVGQTIKRLQIFTDSAHILKAYEDHLKGRKGNANQSMNALETKLTKSEAQKAISQAKMMPNELGRSLSRTEKQFLTELLLHPEALSQEEMEGMLDFILHPEVKLVVRSLKNIYYEIAEEEYIDTVKNLCDRENFSQELKEVVGSALFDYQPSQLDKKQLAKLISDLKRKLQEEHFKHKRTVLIARTKQTESEDEKNMLMEEIVRIEKDLLNIKKTGLLPVK
ncbi:MAG: DNA primase [Bacteriovoracaceae bacterium]